MSTSSVRRLKERGGGGAKITAAATATAAASSTAARPNKPTTPLSEKPIKMAPSGKENSSRLTSRIRGAVSQKPAPVRQLPRIDKSAASAVSRDSSVPRARWSTASVPRGRSSSPSEFNRVLSDLRKTRISRVPVEKCEIDRSRVPPKTRSFRDSDVKLSENGKPVSKNTKDSVPIVAGLEKASELCKELEPRPARTRSTQVKLVAKDIQEDTNPRSSLSKFSLDGDLDSKAKALNGVKVSEKLRSKSCVRLRSSDVADMKDSVGHLSLKESGGKSLNRSSGPDELKEKGSTEDKGSSNKYPSKVHEKLAFLEGKVKRIASDIKRTKEMLDMNNPDASKMILSDIQETVAGIEKAMGHVVGGDDVKNMSSEKITESVSLPEKDLTESSSVKVANEMKSSLKCLNTEQLEARFFPHHKLLRDRTTLKASSVIHKIQDLEIEGAEIKQEDPINENIVELEFLASLTKEESKVATRSGDANSEFCEVKEMDTNVNPIPHDSSNTLNGKSNAETTLTADEKLEEFDDQEFAPDPDVRIENEPDDSFMYQLNEIGRKTSTAGWFVSEGESVLLAHDDGSCSFYDIVNSEEKSVYKPPAGISRNMWKDCWIIRAPNADGCSGRYVVAASAGNATDSGFCSWDFYTKAVKVLHIEGMNLVARTRARTALAPLPNNPLYRRNTLSNMFQENQQWWYKPSGPLIVSTATCQRNVDIYDIRDGEHIMKWETQNSVAALEYSSPLQWRNRGKVVIAESDAVSVWDVASLNASPLLSVSSSGQRISALHVNNTDAELGGGVRQRVSSSEAEGHDGVFCNLDSINVLDFRHPSGIGLRIPKFGTHAHSVFSRGDSIYVGCTSSLPATKRQSSPSQIQHFSLRKQKLFATYKLPESNAHSHVTALTQVWGTSNPKLVMGVCGLGLNVFDASNEDHELHSNQGTAREVIGPDDLESPTFDYLGSRALLISRERPAMWRYLY